MRQEELLILVVAGINPYDFCRGVKVGFLSFKEARAFARKLGLKSSREWEEFSKTDRPDNIPYNPHRTYKGSGWISWMDFLGTDNVNSREIVFLSFKEARVFVRKLGLKSLREWNEYSKTERPDSIPSKPNAVYKGGGWIGWGDFLGTGNVKAKDFLSFKEARAFARKLGLKSLREWNEYSKNSRPNNIPSHPENNYNGKGWVNWGDWLGY